MKSVLNGKESSLNLFSELGKSEWGQFKDSFCYLSFVGTVQTSVRITEEVPGSNNLFFKNVATELDEFNENHFGKTPTGNFLSSSQVVSCRLRCFDVTN